MMKRREFTLLSLFLMGLGLTNCNNSGSQVESLAQSTSSNSNTDTNMLRVWWSQGFYPEETEALQSIVREWEQKSKMKVELSLYSEKDLPKQVESALTTGDYPDILYGQDADWTLIPRLAWDNKLVDVSDIIKANNSHYSSTAVQGVNYQNNSTKKRSYYAVPITQITTHLHCWQDMLLDVGEELASIPKSWQEFWAFWQQMQIALKSKGLSKVYSLGLPVSPIASDSFVIFEQFLEAYDVKLLDEDGQLLLQNAQVRQGIQETLELFVSFYKNQEIPLESQNWANADNNVFFLSRLCLMTANPSLSIPGSQRQNQSIYNTKMSTLRWPDKFDGQPMRHLVSIKQAVIFQSSTRQEVAKDFLSFMIQPETIQGYIKGSQGRYFPVIPKLLEDPFWTDPNDPHFSTAVKQFQNTRPFYQVFNPAYSEVQAKNVWGNILQKVTSGSLSVEEGTLEAIQQIEEIFANWK